MFKGFRDLGSGNYLWLLVLAGSVQDGIDPVKMVIMRVAAKDNLEGAQLEGFLENGDLFGTVGVPWVHHQKTTRF